MKIFYLLFLAIISLLLNSNEVQAQVSFTEVDTVYLENFDGMGTGTTLPANWRVSPQNQAFNWFAPTTVSNVTQVASSGSPTTGGTYNWGTSAGTDRAVGVMASGSFASPSRYIVQLRNDGNVDIDSLFVDFDAERYRRNTAAASVSLQYSFTGLAGSWTGILEGQVTNANLPTGSSEYYFSNPNPVIQRKNIKVPMTVPPGGIVYIAWPITNNTSANSQGIGLDNIKIRAFYTAALEPEISVKGNNAPIANGSTTVSTLDETDFGQACANSGSISRNFVIENNGLVNLNISEATISGSPDFSILIQPAATVAPNGGSTIVQILYQPQTVGTQTAVVTINSNDPVNSVFTFTVEGEVFASLPPVSFLNAASIANGAAFSWNSAPLGCWDDILVVVSDQPVTFSPVGDGSQYTANPVYSGTGEQVVYKGFFNTVAVSGLAVDQTYYAAAFARKGSLWASPALVSFTVEQVIPDNGCANSEFFEREFIVTDSFYVNDISIGVKVRHAERSQLKVILVAPDLTEVVLFDRAGASVADLNVLFSSGASETISNNPHDIALPYEETILPSGFSPGSFSSLIGKVSKGTWVLKICDDATSVIGFPVDFELNLSGCAFADALVLSGSFPDSIRQGDELPTFSAILNCNNEVFTYCNSGEVSLEFTGCGFEGTIVAPVLNGVAVFDDISFLRSRQQDVRLIAKYDGACTQNAIQNQSPTFDVVPSLGSFAGTVLRNENFEAGTPIPWSYTVETTNIFVNVVGLQTFDGNTFLRKTVNTNGTTSIGIVTFQQVTGLDEYDYLELEFKVGSSVGIEGIVGNDNNENFVAQIQRNNAAYTNAFTHRGFSDKKFPFSSSPIIEVNADSDLTLTTDDVTSAFKITIPGGITSLRFRIAAQNNRTDETWCIDDIVLTGFKRGPGVPDSTLKLYAAPIDYCNGAQEPMQVQVTGNKGNTTYQWSPSLGLDNSQVLNPVVSSTASQQYQLIAVDEDACADTVTVNVTVNPVAQILQQPTDQSACAATFDLSVSANAPAYIWEYLDESVNEWQAFTPADIDFDGIDSDALEILSNKAAYDSISVRCVITEEGLCPVISNEVRYFLKPLILLPQSTGTYTLGTPCETDNWTYYADAANEGLFLFAINWAPDGSLSAENAAARSVAQVSITVDDNFFGVEEEIDGQPHATYTMRRYWNVDIGTEQLSEPVIVRFFYDPAERQEVLDAVQDFIAVNPLADEEGFRWFKTKTGPFVPLQNVQAVNVIDAESLNNTNIGLQTERGVLFAQHTNVSSFSGGTGVAGAGPNNTPLPVQLLFFTGVCNANGAELIWATASEKNAKAFIIQRSYNAIDFEDIASVDASGNSNIPLNYSFIDPNPASGLIYYRLKQEDFDGTTEFFRVITVSCGSTDLSFRAYYHPSEGIVALMNNTRNDKLHLRLTDASGKVVYESEEAADKGFVRKALSVQSLAKGFYSLQLIQSTKIYTEKLVVY